MAQNSTKRQRAANLSRALGSVLLALAGATWMAVVGCEDAKSGGEAEDAATPDGGDGDAVSPAADAEGGDALPVDTDSAGDVAEADSAALDSGSDAATDAGDTAAGPDGGDAADGEDVAAGDAAVGPDAPDVECDAIPPGPFPLVKLKGPIASEDLAFDRTGHLVGSNDQTIFKSPYPGQGSPKVFVPSVSFRAGMRFLPNGHLIICDSNKGQLTRIDETGTMHTILSGLSYPNGIVVDLKGWVYFTEQNTNLVSRVHPFTGERQILTDKVAAPNGLTFSPGFDILYIGGFSGERVIYALSISPDGVPGKVVQWATNVGSGALDGMAVDACGNVYVCDYGQTIVYRITPDGQTITPIIDGSPEGAYLPNMQWGSGVGGWDSLSLYFPDGWRKEVFEVHVGVPSAPRAYP